VFRQLIEDHFFRLIRCVPALVLIFVHVDAAAGVEANWSSLSAYQAGDTALEDIGTPIDLDVVDPTATAQARHAAIEQLPPVYRIPEKGKDPTVVAITGSFEATRERFVAAVSRTFGGHPIDHREANSSRFREFRMQFQRENSGFPVGNLVGLTWALDRDDSSLLSPILDAIEDAYAGRVVLDRGDRDLPTELFLLEENLEVFSGRNVPFEAGRKVSRSEIVDLNVVREEVRERLEVDYRPVSAFIMESLKPNAWYDAVLTDAYRYERTRSILVYKHYRSGELLVRKGDLVTEDAKMAFRALDGRLSSRKNVTPSGIVASHPGLRIRQLNQEGGGGFHGLALGFLICLVLLLLVLLAWLSLRHRNSSLITIQAGTGIEPVIPERLAVQLARELQERVVQSFQMQRDDLLQAERTAIMSVLELEARLEKLQPKILAKIREYETRITELENQLAHTEPDHGDRLRGRIEEIRQKLGAELVRHDIILN